MNLRQILITISSSILSSATILGIFAWILKTIIEKRFDAYLKKEEMKYSEVVQKRAEIAKSIFQFCKKITSQMTTKERTSEIEKNKYLEIKVACWFSDDTYIKFRDFLGNLYKDPNGKWCDWHNSVEPVLQEIIKSIRPRSNILNKKGFILNKKTKPYNFLPNQSFNIIDNNEKK